MHRPMRCRAPAVLLAVVAALAGCTSTPVQESTGQYLDASVITARVKSSLLADSVTTGLAIAVDTFKDVVQLSGFVNTPEEKRRAQEIAQAVPGVREVRNDIIVK